MLQPVCWRESQPGAAGDQEAVRALSSVIGTTFPATQSKEGQANLLAIIPALGGLWEEKLFILAIPNLLP